MENTTTLEMQSSSKTRFWLSWVGLNALGLGLAYILSSVQFFQLLAGALFPNISQQAANWVYLVFVVFSAVVIAFAQWLALRSWLKEAYWWLAATALGWVFIFLISSSEVNTFVSAVTTRNRMLTSFMFLLAFAGRGLVVGLPQWLALRLEHPQSRSWIGWATLGTTVSTAVVFLPLTLMSTIPSPSPFVTQLLTIMSQPDLTQLGILGFVQGAIVAAVSGAGLVKILTRPAGRWDAEALSNPWRRFLLYWSLATLLGLFINFEFAPSFLSNLANSTTNPTLHNILTGLFSGVVIGILQWTVLRDHFKDALLWVAVTALAFAFAGFNQDLLPVLYPDTSFLSLATFGDVLRTVIFMLTGNLGFWIILGVFQAVVLVLWLGRRAWMWAMAVPAIQVFGLLASLVLWGPIGSIVFALGGGMWLIYLIRSGLLEEAYFAPQTGLAPTADELDLAAQILQERMAEAWDIRGRTTVESGRLRVEVGDLDDVDAVSDLALQPGNAVFFKAGGSLEDGASLPEGAEIVLTGDEMESVSAADAAKGTRHGLEIKLTDEGQSQLEKAWKKARSLHLGLALDGEVIAALDVESLAPDGVYFVEPFSLDADFLAAIMDNEPLPFSLKVAEDVEAEDAADEEESGAGEEEEDT